jgi:2-C-methyl-D-erythritol 2,4-cyclodiphosphate synthase
LARLNRVGWRVVNVDVIIFAQEPKLGPMKDLIRKNLALLLGLDPGAVNVKAKTGERVGAIGRAEAIGCQVVALIDNSN